MSECKARQYSDQMVCDQCGICWDMNDPEPPECLPRPVKVVTKSTPGRGGGYAEFIKLRDKLK